jgi:tetratricopeptide (TPR) repeat protein
MKTWQALAAIVVLMSVAVLIQVRRDQGWQAYEPATPVMWLKAGPAMERATLGYDALVADLYWMRAVVYFGRQRLSEAEDKNYDLLYPLLDLVTSLDPKFAVAYRFGASFLTERPPGGPDRPDLAIRLLERALEENPTRWEYPHDLAFVHYFSYQDYITASQWFRRASEVPNAPNWLPAVAAATVTRGGDRDASRLIWRELYKSAEAEAIRENALVHLAQLDAFDQVDKLTQLVRRYKVSAQRFPASWDELVAARLLTRTPEDPTGVPYVLNPENEDVRIGRSSALWAVAAGLERYQQ